ncbi:vesicle-associated membrane protein-associated protein A isoform X2 [Plutella xylostella]|uniref:vesicle-associated membrane protein-associated protein A isoform X2 n=1 Tax=Plutella xylostella TaxID=51655 RepID=UPI0018D0B107|nr:vesicle-associated membrane protein-associated protein A isoform X2 [Plutella xylostella]
MPNQVLFIEPQNELKFKVDFTGHFEQGNTTYMRLTNPTADTVLFKIKTTAPKKYCVRPNSGMLDPHSKVDIAITPQVVFVDSNEKYKHKFMVQSVIAPEGKTNIDQVWKEISPDQLMDYKLKCVFETPGSTNTHDAGDAAQNDATKKRVAAETDAKPAIKEPVEALVSTTSKPDGPQNTMAYKIDPASAEKAADEIVQAFKQEESKLIHENLELKEEVLRLRLVAGGGAARRHSYGPEKTAQASLMPWLAMSIGMAFIGILIGKFLM